MRVCVCIGGEESATKRQPWFCSDEKIGPRENDEKRNEERRSFEKRFRRRNERKVLSRQDKVEKESRAKVTPALMGDFVVAQVQQEEH